MLVVLLAAIVFTVVFAVPWWAAGRPGAVSFPPTSAGFCLDCKDPEAENNENK